MIFVVSMVDLRTPIICFAWGTLDTTVNFRLERLRCGLRDCGARGARGGGGISVKSCLSINQSDRPFEH
eukprot:m.219679 g.219679  ORF g.219679 m.219679 type:complete len:69 (+) comp33300_c1_seq1:3539-3745(+)